MATWGKKSREVLGSCVNQIQDLFNEVIKYFDCKGIYGYRNQELQFELFKRGRIEKNGVWVVENKLLVITNCDGYIKKSNHNFLPSKAIDIAPYPINWRDINRMYYFAGFVKGIAQKMGIKIRWGGDWDGDTDLNDQTFNDLVHFEVKE